MQSYLSLQQLLLNIQGQLRQSFSGSYWIKAEVAGVRRVGKHIYFELLQISSGQKVAQIRATAFYAEGTEAILDFENVTGQKFMDGIKVGLRASVNFHPVYGLSLNLLEMDAELTLGGIELQRKQTLDLLVLRNPGLISLQDGTYITPNKLLPVPGVIQRVAVITSRSSDAYADFMHCLDNNGKGYCFHIHYFEALVHGYSSSGSIQEAFDQVQASGNKYDVVVLIRGGGAPADFLPYDDYNLALRVATFPFPVLTGIGHQMNQGIVDFFARIHMKTPTMAAQFMIDHNIQFESRLSSLSESISQTTKALMVFKKNKFLMLQSGVVNATKLLLQDNSFQISKIETNLYPSALRSIRSHSGKLEKKQLQISFRLPFCFAALQKNLFYLKEHIQSLSPEKLLKRGFALIKKNSKFVVNEELTSGDKIEIILHSNAYEADIIRRIQT